MIRVEDLGGPQRVSEPSPNKPEESPIPVITDDDQVREMLRRKIAHVRSSVTRIARKYKTADENYQDIFDMRVGRENSPVTNLNGKPIGEVERGHLQNLAFEIMIEFGLDLNQPRPRWEEMPWRYADGTSREIIRYPSNTPGMMFEQWRDFHTESGKTMNVSWSVIDTLPDWRIDLKAVTRTIFSRPRSAISNSAA